MEDELEDQENRYSKVERRSSNLQETAADARDEIKNFKENLLRSLSTGESIISNNLEEPRFERSVSRERSASRARDSLVVSPSVLVDIDETRIFELKEAFLLFDLDGDGFIDHNDLKATLISLGESVDDKFVKTMLSEAMNPLDFDAFVNLLGYKTLELDSEETLVAALSRWDKDGSGLISEDSIRHDLMTWGDRFTEKEANYALDDAPTVNKGGHTMIDYLRFCSQLCGLRKTKSDSE